MNKLSVQHKRIIHDFSTPGKKLSTTDYTGDDVVEISRSLIGKVLCSNTGEGTAAGVITEAEAYCGRNDRGCHANNGLRTPRTEVMYGPPGHAYVYLCYGIHHLFNVVTNQTGLADAVLVRAILPLQGIDLMSSRRSMPSHNKRLADGPGKLTTALGITTQNNGTDLSGSRIWIEDRGIPLSAGSVRSSKRIGIDYAGEDAARPWRFHLPDPALALYKLQKHL